MCEDIDMVAINAQFTLVVCTVRIVVRESAALTSTSQDNPKANLVHTNQSCTNIFYTIALSSKYYNIASNFRVP